MGLTRREFINLSVSSLPFLVISDNSTPKKKLLYWKPYIHPNPYYYVMYEEYENGGRILYGMPDIGSLKKGDVVYFKGKNRKVLQIIKECRPA